MQHTSNIYNQYRQIKSVKESFLPGDALLHRYQAHQSTPFGASKTQVSLHTGVLYSYGQEPQCIGTFSDCNRHDMAAVVAHLNPEIECSRWSLKRTADDLVAKGAGVTDCQTTVPLLKGKCPGIIIETITAESIMEIAEEVPEDLATFKDTNNTDSPINSDTRLCFES
ncbi:hypothetical protein PR048_010777 [Dryococelus australis]|uniref:Uncharacterized protein n=1 Tax=Dryococelus australis TaxID=614101 RepID=A0ABQ9I4H0_9NEOP|nr:hypothetical protein PR048_010777 [Dryococelus australis]